MTQLDRAGGYSGELTTVVSQDEENDVLVVVSTAGSVLVRVRTRTGEPLAGCTLARVMDPAGSTPFLVLRYVGKIDDEGACRIARMRIDAGATIGFVLPDLEPSFPFGATQWAGGESELEIEVPDRPDPGTLRFDCGSAFEDGFSPTPSLFVRADDANAWLGRTVGERGSCSYEGCLLGLSSDRERGGY